MLLPIAPQIFHGIVLRRMGQQAPHLQLPALGAHESLEYPVVMGQEAAPLQSVKVSFDSSWIAHAGDGSTAQWNDHYIL